MKHKTIQVVLCEPGKASRITSIDNTLHAMQLAVGGGIQAIYRFDDPVAIICNEDGKVNGTELNRALREENGRIHNGLYCFLFGDVGHNVPPVHKNSRGCVDTVPALWSFMSWLQ